MLNLGTTKASKPSWRPSTSRLPVKNSTSGPSREWSRRKLESVATTKDQVARGHESTALKTQDQKQCGKKRHHYPGESQKPTTKECIETR